MLGNFKINRKDLPFINHFEIYDFQYENDIKCAVKKKNKIIEKAKFEDKKISKHLKKEKLKMKPRWFNNLAVNQVAAANMICLALQRPTIKEQLNCMKHIITALKLKKPPTEKQLTSAIEFSRGNDLAFLWYLYKSVNKSTDEICSQKKFTKNEKIVLSCICHLDMLTTLRQLDKILPKPSNDRIKNKKNPAKILKPVPDLKIYEVYEDEFYIIENEENRWFERDFLIPSKQHCWAQRLIMDQIKNLDQIDREKLFRNDAGKLKEFLKNLEHENEDKCEITKKINHLTNSEQKITCNFDQQLKETEKDFKNNQKKKETQIVAAALVNQCVDDAFNQRFLHLCEKCENPQMERQKLQVKERSTTYSPNTVKYFHLPSSISDSFKFDYEKIFSLNFLHDQHDVAKKSINAALELNKYLTVDNAITACLRDMWQKKLREWNEKRQAEIEERQHRVVFDCSSGEVDKEAAFKLLQKGIALMRKNSKFLLAALPQSHRLPILKEWILQSITYTLIPLTLATTTCTHHEYWDTNLNECVPCTKCNRHQIVIRPCQRHLDTVCRPINSVDIDWSKSLSMATEKAQMRREHHRIMTIIACLLFFTVTAIISINYVRQWRKIKKEFDTDIEQLSQQLMARLAIPPSDTATIFIDDPTTRHHRLGPRQIEVRCIYLDDIIAGKESLKDQQQEQGSLRVSNSPAGNVYIEDNEKRHVIVGPKLI
ncbi:hypothetical protein PVAND_013998 [Polypedilum vanderplanki]|uniref:TNFR-Cys domain-containing protein n=1 Tax=Polypedilum vanderplanki TaxID=319348 RepID=A0A9J6CRF7_POLVA|nr:hypothetical protein PVAND_013998 [Polypedilum vanderplanki]